MWFECTIVLQDLDSCHFCSCLAGSLLSVSLFFQYLFKLYSSIMLKETSCQVSDTHLRSENLGGDLFLNDRLVVVITDRIQRSEAAPVPGTPTAPWKSSTKSISFALAVLTAWCLSQKRTSQKLPKDTNTAIFKKVVI